MQPVKLKDPDFLSELKSLEADLFIVIAFRMLPKEVWQMPKLGTFNIHGSLLPQYRGAAPINWAIINGEKETGAKGMGRAQQTAQIHRLADALCTDREIAAHKSSNRSSRIAGGPCTSAASQAPLPEAG